MATRYDLDLNILVRADRANRLGIADANGESWVPGPHAPVYGGSRVDLPASGDRIAGRPGRTPPVQPAPTGIRKPGRGFTVTSIGADRRSS